VLRKFFQQYDTTGIGHLNYDQFKKAISTVGYTEEDYRKIFEAVVRSGCMNHFIMQQWSKQVLILFVDCG
jgi:hypothetical protein